MKYHSQARLPSSSGGLGWTWAGIMGGMHTWHGKSCKIHHDGDFRGEVRVVQGPSMEAFERGSVTVNADDLAEFVAERLRRQLISRIEQAPASELLGVGKT